MKYVLAFGTPLASVRLLFRISLNSNPGRGHLPTHSISRHVLAECWLIGFVCLLKSFSILQFTLIHFNKLSSNMVTIYCASYVNRWFPHIPCLSLFPLRSFCHWAVEHVPPILCFSQAAQRRSTWRHTTPASIHHDRPVQGRVHGRWANCPLLLS